MLCLILLWQSIASKIASPIILPLPIVVFKRICFFFQSEKFILALYSTASRCFLSFALVIVAGFVCGMLSAFSAVFAAFVAPVLALVRATPVISVLLIALFWLKSDFVSVFVAFLMAFPVMTNAAQSAFLQSAAKSELYEMAKYYKITRFERLCFLRLPAAFPFLEAGIKSVAGMIWKLIVAGEVLSIPRSAVGAVLQNVQIVLETADVFAITIIIIFLSFVFCTAVNLFLFALVFLAKRFKTAYFYKWHFWASEIDKNCDNNADICVKRISFAYNDDDVEIYKDFSLNFSAHTVSVILAPSGCGKTTLLNRVAASELDKGRNVAYLFQEARLLPCLTVQENVALPILHRRFNSKQGAMQAAAQMLSRLGLSEKCNAHVQELSGGERQRAAIARAFAYCGDIMLLDEPFQSQDFVTKMSLIALFHEIRDEKSATAIVVTHDPKEAALLGNRIIILRGRPVEIAADFEKNSCQDDEIEKKIIEVLMK